jgi:hypothetical protein
MGFSFAAFINIFGPRLVKRGLCAQGQRMNCGGDAPDRAIAMEYGGNP